MAPLETPPGTKLLCVVATSPSLGLEEVGGAEETGVVVAAGFSANKNASRSMPLSPTNDSDTAEDDDGPFSDGVTVGVVVMIGVDEVGVIPAPRSREDDEVRASRKASRSEVETSPIGPPVEVVVFEKTKRRISFFKNRGLSKSSRACAGAAAAKHFAELSVDRHASNASNITPDVWNMMKMEYNRRIDGYY